MLPANLRYGRGADQSAARLPYAGYHVDWCCAQPTAPEQAGAPFVHESFAMAPPTAPEKSARTAYDAIMAQARDLFRDRLCAALAAMLERADEALYAIAEKEADGELQRRTLDARALVVDHRAGIEEQFRARWLAEFRKRTQTAQKLAPSVSDIGADELELVAEDDLNETLRFNDLAARLRGACDEALAALDQRVRVVLGDAALKPEDDPFGPAVICDGFKQACRALDFPLDLRLELTRIFDEEALDAIGAAYDDVNELFIDNGILPKIRYAITRRHGKAAEARKDAPAPPPAAPAAPAAPAMPQEMFAALARMLVPGGAPTPAAPGMGVGGVPQVYGDELFETLTRLQVGDLSELEEQAPELAAILEGAQGLKNVLHPIKSTRIGASLGHVDAMTLDIVARLFDEIFDDPKIPIALKGLIARLQLPFLKVAIADKALFDSKSHPARLLLDLLGRIGLRLPADFDAGHPLFTRIEEVVANLVACYADGMESFDEARSGLEAIVAEDDARIAREMEEAQAQLRNAERLAIATSAAQDLVRARVEAAPGAPRAVVQFLAQEWMKTLVIAHARDDEGSAAWKSAAGTVDELLRSVTPKATPEERRELSAAIPGLLRELKAGIATAGTPEPVASAFLAELMKCHTEVMRPTPAPQPARKARETATVEAGKRGAGRRAARGAPPAAEDADFSAPVTLANPFGGGQVEVSAQDLDFTARTMDEAAVEGARGAAPATTGRRARPAVHLPAGMIMGAWVEILDDTQDGNAMRAARLHYVSPMRSHFLFVDRKGRKVYECSRTMLARRLALGEVVILDGEPDASLFDRILEGLFGKLRVASPA